MELNVPQDAEDAIRADIQSKADMQSLDLLMQIADAEGDISEYLTSEQIARVVDQVCETYEIDKQSRSDWADVAEAALKEIGNTKADAKDFPWPNASNVKYPLLATAVMQFNARAYPAVVKGDEAVSCKVVDNDTGMPVLDQCQCGAHLPVIRSFTCQNILYRCNIPRSAKNEVQQIEHHLIDLRERAFNYPVAQRIARYLNCLVFTRTPAQ